MIFVVDVEGFFVKNHFIVKEFAYIRTEDSKIERYLFKAPFSFNHLSFREKQTVSYCEKNLHQLRWSSGIIKYQDRLSVIRNVFQPSDVIYVKGDQKVRFIEELLPFTVKVINLETLNCPKVIDIKSTGKYTKCESLKHQFNIHCSLFKVQRFASFLKSNDIEN